MVGAQANRQGMVGAMLAEVGARFSRWARRPRPRAGGEQPTCVAVVAPLRPPSEVAAVSKDARRGPEASYPTPEAQRHPIAAPEAASAFLAWLREHGLAREWAVDDLWFFAEADFAEAADLTLPPRRVFLGALQKLDGVAVVYDRRTVRNGTRVKTTFYSFDPEPIEAAPVPMLLAA